jgi:hypothetical protein
VPDDGGIEQDLATIYGDDETEEKSEHRKRLWNADGTPNGFQQTALKGRARRERDEQASKRSDELDRGPAPIPSVTPEFEGDIPEPVEGYEDRVDLVAAIKGRLSIEGAVRQFGKPQAGLKIGKRTEGIHVRCPFPSHPDNNPSAWINTLNDTWFCGACQIGGDQIDFYAAIQHGSIDHGQDFRTVLVELAERLGIDPEPPQPLPPMPEPESDPEPPAPPPAPEPPVVPNEPEEPETVTVEQVTEGIDPESLEWDTRDDFESFEGQDILPSYDWRNLQVPKGTFLHEWMTYNQKHFAWIPSEYFLMLGFQALGLATGHDLTVPLAGHRLTGSTMMAIIGPSQYGKTTAANQLQYMFESLNVTSYDPSTGTGIRVFGTPGSPEALIKDIKIEIEDPQDPTQIIEVPANIWLLEQEFATFVSRTNRKGGDHMKTRIIELHDFSKRRDEPETVIRDYSISNGVRIIHDSYLSATFLTQTDALREHIKSVDLVSGFFQRIHPVFGPSLADRDLRQDILPDPEYPQFFANIWNRVRGHGRQMLRVSRECLDYLTGHHFFAMLKVYSADTSLLSRLDLYTHRFAFLLAVNDGSSAVEIKHYDLAMHLVKNYSLPCYGYLLQSAKASDSKDLADRVVEFIRRYFGTKGAWPERRQIAQQRFWRNAPEWMQEVALNTLANNQQIVRVTLKHGASTSVAYVCPDDGTPWARYASSDGAKFEKDAFYANT